MSEEEIIKEINIIKETVVDIFEYDLTKYKEDIYKLDTKQVSALLSLLDLYNKEKEQVQLEIKGRDMLADLNNTLTNENANLKKEIKMLKKEIKIQKRTNQALVNTSVDKCKVKEIRDKLECLDIYIYGIPETLKDLDNLLGENNND